MPEVAARAHVESLNPLLEQALSEAGVGFRGLDGVAVTVGPGLVGALLVGMAAAKAISLSTGAPLIGVNHLEGHVWANFLAHGEPDPPYVSLVVSGGHTMLVHIAEMHRHEVLGQTSMTRPARRSTRWRGSSAWDSPGARRSTPSRPRATREPSDSRGRWRIRETSTSR